MQNVRKKTSFCEHRKICVTDVYIFRLNSKRLVLNFLRCISIFNYVYFIKLEVVYEPVAGVLACALAIAHIKLRTLIQNINEIWRIDHHKEK